MRTRKQMEESIKAGRSVIYKGQHYVTIDSLPTEAELAKGDKAREEEARRTLKAQMLKIQSQLAMLDDTGSHSVPFHSNLDPDVKVFDNSEEGKQYKAELSGESDKKSEKKATHHSKASESKEDSANDSKSDAK